MSEGSPESKSLYIPYDQFLFRRITDICIQFTKTYQRLGVYRREYDNLHVARKLANLFMILFDFACECDELPNDIKNPPLIDWDMKPGHVGCELGKFNIHPRLANRWVMRLLNEMKRQQGEQKRDINAIIDELGA